MADVATEGQEEPHEHDQKHKPGMATETTETDSQTTPAEVAETPPARFERDAHRSYRGSGTAAGQGRRCARERPEAAARCGYRDHGNRLADDARRGRRDPQHDSNAMPIVATEGQEQPPARVADAHENDQKQPPGVATETTETDSQTTPAEIAETESAAQMTPPIPGWKPHKLANDAWGAVLEGDLVR